MENTFLTFAASSAASTKVLSDPFHQLESCIKVMPNSNQRSENKKKLGDILNTKYYQYSQKKKAQWHHI